MFNKKSVAKWLLAIALFFALPAVSVKALSSFDSSFEGGNGLNFVENGDAVSFDGELDPGSGSYKRTTWFYFSMDNVLGRTITFTMNNARGANTETLNWVGKRPVYSYDQLNWFTVAADGTGGASAGQPFNFIAPGAGQTFSQNLVYIAYNVPYTYTDALNDINRWDDSGLFTGNQVIGQSAENRDIHLLTFEDLTSTIPSAEKKVLWVYGRQHPMETAASYFTQGLVDFYLNQSDPEAAVFRNNWILAVVPDANPDGMYLGLTRTNVNGWDLNREWSVAGPDQATEEVEVFEAHQAVEDWSNAGHNLNLFLDMHTRSSAAPGAYYPSSNFDHVVLQHNFDFLSNQAAALFGLGSTNYCSGMIYAQYGASAYTIEGPDVRYDAANYPTIANNRAWGKAWAMAGISQLENQAKVFAFKENSEGTSPSTRVLITAPGKYHLVADLAKGGAFSRWYDLENQAYHQAQLADTANGLDRLEWQDATLKKLANSTNAYLVEYRPGTNFVNLKISGQLNNAAGYDYLLNKTFWQDGRVFESFDLTNNTASAVDWQAMTYYSSLANSNFSFLYDNTDATPTFGTDHWFAQVGTSAGSPAIKASLAAYVIGQSGGFNYDAYGSSSTLPRNNYYRDANGPLQPVGQNIKVNTVYQFSPDNDSLNSQAGFDTYATDLIHPDNPLMAQGQFTVFNQTLGGLEFQAESNKASFTYTNAQTYLKKKPVYIINNYSAPTPPILKIDQNYLDGETGESHPGLTYASLSYTSYVDLANQVAYVQYLNDFNYNAQIEIADYFALPNLNSPTNVSAIWQSDTQADLTWLDNAVNEDGFMVERREDAGTGFGPYQILATLPADTLTYSDATLSPDSRYQYRVKAYNTLEHSAYATDPSYLYTTPEAPAINTPVVNSASSVTWRWYDQSNFEENFHLTYTAGSGSDQNSLAANSGSIQAIGLTPNTAYSVELKAYRVDRGESLSSGDSALIYTYANIPSNLSLVANSTVQVTASWLANNNPAGTQYWIENITNGTNSSWITSTSWISTGLTRNTNYTFRVKARNAENIETAFSPNVTIRTPRR